MTERELLAIMAAIVYTPPTLDEERESTTARRAARAEAVEDATAILALLQKPSPANMGPR